MSKKNLSIIVAVAENWAIGKGNRLLWHISDDLKRFKKITSGHPVIMGRNTWLSLPVRPLPGRKNIVITDNPEEQFEGAVMAHSIDEAVSFCPDGEECFIMGGGSVYRQFLPMCNTLYITWVCESFDADTFFPKIDPAEWVLDSSEKIHDDPSVPFKYEFRIYRRKD